jgi:hypothetical protein
LDNYINYYFSFDITNGVIGNTNEISYMGITNPSSIAQFAGGISSSSQYAAEGCEVVAKTNLNPNPNAASGILLAKVISVIAAPFGWTGYVSYTTDIPHGLSVGRQIYISGLTPIGYNVNGVKISRVVSPTEFILRNTTTGVLLVSPGTISVGAIITSTFRPFTLAPMGVSRSGAGPNSQTIIFQVTTTSTPSSVFEFTFRAGSGINNNRPQSTRPLIRYVSGGPPNSDVIVTVYGRRFSSV